MSSGNDEFELGVEEVEVSVLVDVSWTHTPGNVSGPADVCFPPETEITYSTKQATIAGVTVRRKMNPADAVEAIEELLSVLGGMVNDDVEKLVEKEIY